MRHYLLIIAFGANSCLILCCQPQVFAQFSQGIGIETSVSSSITGSTLNRTIYQGECSGQIEHAETSYFVSDSFPPSPGLRVRLTNMSRGLSPDNPPLTLREYSKGRASQSFDMVVGTKHRGQYFVVREGSNIMQYEIMNGGTVINSGTFDYTVQVQTRYQQRNKRPVEVTKYNEDGSTYKATEYQCP
jgi:hypothetical protein